MIPDLYSHLMFCAGILLIYFGIYCIYGSVPPKEIYKHYQKARFHMGIGFLIFSLMFLLHWLFDFRGWNSKVASALNLTVYYLTAILFGKAFFILLIPEADLKKKSLVYLRKWLIFVAILWIPLALPTSDHLRYVVLVLATIFFFVDGIRIIIGFTRNYREVLRKMDDFYTEETAIFVRWISQSAYILSIFALFVGAINFLPKWCISIYVVGSLLTFMFIFNGMMNYLIHYADVQVAVMEKKSEPVIETEKLLEKPEKEEDESDTSKEIENMPNQEELAAHLEAWIEQKMYLQKELTIEQIANEVKSNRTYVSTFINQRYGTTFREWIALLRIEEAERLLLKNPDLTSAELAEQVGYATQRTFQKFFVQYTGYTPKEWTKHNSR